MAADLLEQALRILEGVYDFEQGHPLRPTIELCEVADGVAFVSSFANCTAVDTGDGLVLVDTGSSLHRGRASTPSCAAGGATACTPRSSPTATSTTSSASSRFEEEAAADGWRGPARRRPRGACRAASSATCSPPATTRSSTAASSRSPRSLWPTSSATPTSTYSHRRSTLARRRRAVELHHARGETDDAHLGLAARARRVLCTGDLFIWATPNAGNPQKVQRYPREWARRAPARWPRSAPSCSARATARRSSARTAIRQALDRDGGAARVACVDQTLALMNAGRAPRRDRRHGAGRRPTCSSGPTCSRSTTSPSSSCATSGASTAAGRTATRRTSSRRPSAALAGELARAGRRRRPGWPSAPSALADGRRDLRLAGHLGGARAAGRARRPRGRRRPRRASTRRARPRRPRSWRAASSPGPRRVVRQGRRRARLTRSPRPRPVPRAGAVPTGSRAKAGAAG